MTTSRLVLRLKLTFDGYFLLYLESSFVYDSIDVTFDVGLAKHQIGDQCLVVEANKFSQRRLLKRPFHFIVMKKAGYHEDVFNTWRSWHVIYIAVVMSESTHKVHDPDVAF